MNSTTAFAVEKFRAWRRAERAARTAEVEWLRAAAQVSTDERGDYDAAINKAMVEEEDK